MENIEINPKFVQVLDFVNQTNQAVFLTGKAGTGKTTLLRYIRQKTFKQIAIVAPTGVAAINAGGSTIHSFFQFPFTPFLPLLKSSGAVDYSGENLPTLKYNSQRLGILRNLELLVIDEISMVRADLLDQIDLTLRFTRKKSHLPFGGVQVLLIGDMYQLPPVVQSSEWSLLSKVYKTPYFFDSLVMRNNRPVYIELDKIYRQSEKVFVDLLNKVRNDQLDAAGLELLNSRYKGNLTEKDYHENITLTTHNRKADEINSRNLNSLPGKTFTYRAKVEGNFSEKNYPADESLHLKVGTRVMFLKNNAEKNYYNGKIGIVTFLDENKIKVKCDEDRIEIEVVRETWNNVTYSLNDSTKHIDEEIQGSFNHFPLRLAWSITIHKSQGLTFDKLIIDAAEAFSAGQVYVALSRCRSIGGLILSSKIQPSTLANDKQILSFAKGAQNEEQVNMIFSESRQVFSRNLLHEVFDLNVAHELRMEIGGLMQANKKHLGPTVAEEFAVLASRIDTLKDVSQKFLKQLSVLFEQSKQSKDDSQLQQRIAQAAVYFKAEIQKCLDYFNKLKLSTENRQAAEDLELAIQELFENLYRASELQGSLFSGFDFTTFISKKLSLKYPEKKIEVKYIAKSKKEKLPVSHPDLYRELLFARDKIIAEDHRPNYIVADARSLTEMTNYLPTTHEALMKISGFAEAKVEAYGDIFLKVIREYMNENGISSNMDLLPEKKKSSSKKTKTEPKAPVQNTREKSFEMFRNGMTIPQIAKERSLTQDTIANHLITFIQKGEILISELVSATHLALIEKALEKFSYEQGLGIIKSQLPEEISFAEIRFVMAHRLKD